MQQRHNGFSLIELIITISMLAIMAGVAFYSWPATDFSIDAESRLLAYNLQYAQMLAVTRGQWVRIQLQRNRYHIQLQDGEQIANADIQLRQNTRITTSNGLGRNLFYLADGAPARNRNNALTQTVTITLANANTAHTLTIAPITGVVY